MEREGDLGQLIFSELLHVERVGAMLKHAVGRVGTVEDEVLILAGRRQDAHGQFAVGGALLGVVGSVGINAAQVPVPVGVQFVLLSDKLVVLPTAQWVLATIVFITLVVTAISIVPSFIAARLKPVTAMQHAG